MQWLHAACHLGCLHLVVALVSSSFAFCQGVKSLQSSSRTCTGLPPGAMHSKYIKKGRRTTTKPWSFEIPCRAKAWALLSREDESCVSELEPLVHKLLFSHLIPAHSIHVQATGESGSVAEIKWDATADKEKHMDGWDVGIAAWRMSRNLLSLLQKQLPWSFRWFTAPTSAPISPQFFSPEWHRMGQPQLRALCSLIPGTGHWAAGQISALQKYM